MPAWLIITGISGWPGEQVDQPQHLAGIGLQVEATGRIWPSRPKPARQAGSPGHVARGVGAARIGMPVDDVADAANRAVCGVGFQQRLDAGIVERGEGDEAALGMPRSSAIACSQRSRPAAERLRARIDMDDAPTTFQPLASAR
jgi:hypothetical protein